VPVQWRWRRRNHVADRTFGPTGARIDAGNEPTRFLRPAEVTQLFKGYVAQPDTRCGYVRGSLDHTDLAARMGEGPLEESDTSVGDFSVFTRADTAVGVPDGELFRATREGYNGPWADPIPALRDLLNTAAGDAESYAENNPACRRLLDELHEGHWIDARSFSNHFENARYGRQYDVGPRVTAPREVLVYEDDPPSRDTIAATAREAPLFESLPNGAIEEVTIDDPAATITYRPVETGEILRLSG